MPTLYHSPHSRSERNVWTIEEMGLDCEIITSPYPPRTKYPDYMSINPLGTVPVLIDGPVRLIESVAISQYLATRYGPTDIAVGTDEPDYGTYLDFMQFGEATLGASMSPYVRFARQRTDLGFQGAGEYFADTFISDLAYLERQLENRDHLCAGRFTNADIIVCWSLMLARMLGLGERMPAAVLAYLDRQLARPAYQRAAALRPPSS